jgi:hypothetical protein
VNHESYLEEVRLLKEDPSISSWATHIRRLQAGVLDEYVRDRGSFEDYVATILANSRDPFIARTVFGEALKDVVQGWIPSALDRPAAVVMLADLIAAYMPEGGYLKLFSKLQDQTQMRLTENIKDPMDLAFDRDLRRKILNTLDSYFAVATPRGNVAYRQYIRVLESHLTMKNYVGLAASLLFKRGHITLVSKKLSTLIEREPTVIGPILMSILRYGAAINFERDIKNLYEHTLQAGEAALDIFTKEVQRNGGAVDLRAESPFIQFTNRERIYFGLPENVISSETFFRKRWRDAKKDWSGKELQIKKELMRVEE